MPGKGNVVLNIAAFTITENIKNSAIRNFHIHNKLYTFTYLSTTWEVYLGSAETYGRLHV